MMNTHDVALQVMQDSINILIRWTEANLSCKPSIHPRDKAVIKAKNYLNWSDNLMPQALKLLFDFVDFSDRENQQELPQHYYPVGAIADFDPVIPYPLESKPDLSDYQKVVKTALENLQTEDWENLSLLTLFVEKYGSCLSYGESNIALTDLAKSTAAIASALVDNDNPESDEIALIAGDLSGIQKFIYTISSEGALKSLRARSFYLELVAEEIVQQLLEKLDLPRTSVIYAGGGNLYILAPSHQNTQNTVNQVQSNFNRWLKNKFQSKIFLALAISEPFHAKDVFAFKDAISNKSKFAEHWEKAIIKVNQQKSQKFINQIDDLLKIKVSYEQKCRVCHRDDTTNLKEVENDDGELILQCLTCRKISQLGSQLFKATIVVRSKRQDIPGKLEKLSFHFPHYHRHYHLFENKDSLPELQEQETVFFINNWETKNYQFKNSVPFLLGNYGQESEEEKPNFIRANEMAKKAKGIKRVGYLRMDVDNLGKIFAKGFQNKTIQNLPRITGLSRLMTYFFKVYLNSLAKDRCVNLPKGTESLNLGDRPNLLFIYAGGDDLFISGTWNEIVDFGFDIYQAFRGYTGYNPNITLSGGISLADVKFPLYQAANESGEAENKAKGNGRDSLGLFGEVFKWDEWLGNYQSQVMDEEIRTYLGAENLPSLFGILPFVKKLYNIENQNYSRSFVRNLLATAQVQNQMIKEIEEKHKNRDYQGQERDIRYYLHLPKIAYTLARLPKQVLEDDEEFRKSLKSPYNAPYFQAIATWIELLNRKENYDSSND
ncbi:type III-A CRISPR-associated protein Cas10/Csm1 [Planktothrix mougeotii LEGE 06226]|uniref:CRISPR system single-strand-specific deoxyribonuclease Cas10/Csm1 (subtype III-A) n=2 Tax=Planktothrix mougeotii TaxID=54306 RepID=A0ABR9U696_9CYAN|nr:type III-A CRISPR-associated protein Cas10/Csm1 [Planktothrix mougeotii LEGE 06226]